MIQLLGVKGVRHLPLNSVLLLHLEIGPLPFNFDFLENNSYNRLFDSPRQNHKDAGEPVHLYLTETPAIDN